MGFGYLDTYMLMENIELKKAMQQTYEDMIKYFQSKGQESVCTFLVYHFQIQRELQRRMRRRYIVSIILASAFGLAGIVNLWIMGNSRLVQDESSSIGYILITILLEGISGFILWMQHNESIKIGAYHDILQEGMRIWQLMALIEVIANTDQTERIEDLYMRLVENEIRRKKT